MPAWDAPLTVGLLVFGLIQVTQTVAQSRDLVPILDGVLQANGAAAYTNAEAASVGGLLLAGSHVLSLVLAIGFSVPRLRTRRRAFWVPVVCAAMAFVATTAIVVGLVAVDPAYLAQLQPR